MRNIEIQATTPVKSIKWGTGYELLNAYFGEKGDLIIKKNDKNNDKETDKNNGFINKNNEVINKI